MKNVLNCSLGLFLMFLLFSCTNNGHVKDEIRRGIYNGANQIQDLKHSDDTSSVDKATPSYNTYRHEREEMLQNKTHE